jgi:hypothetical protein
MAKLKNLLGGWQLRSLKGMMDTGVRQFPADLLTPKQVLICLPGGLRELTLVKQFLPEISSLFRGASVSLLAMPGVKVHDIYPRRGYQILTPSADQLRWSGVPKRSFLETLKGYGFDLLLDLNLEFSYFTAGVLLSFPSAIRVGRGNHLGPPFYNIEIKTRYLRDERNIYRSLLETLEHIMQVKSEVSGTEPGNN